MRVQLIAAVLGVLGPIWGGAFLELLHPIGEALREAREARVEMQQELRTGRLEDED